MDDQVCYVTFHLTDAMHLWSTQKMQKEPMLD
jgi:hypothetical protein